MNRRRVSSLPASFPCVSLTASDRYNPGVPTNSAPVRNAVASIIPCVLHGGRITQGERDGSTARQTTTPSTQEIRVLRVAGASGERMSRV